jgi:CBS domain-containing protein
MDVSELMTAPPITAAPGVPVLEALMIGALPVVDGATLIGIITETDLLRAFVKSA